MSGHTEAEVVIDAPRDFVFDRTNDLSIWPDMFTEYESVDLLEHDGDTFLFRLTTKPDEEGHKWSWISRRRMIRDEWRIEAHRVEPLRPFSEMRIRWWYEDLDGVTRMRWVQDFTVHPEAPFSDADAVRHISENTPIQMAAIKRYLEDAWQRRSAETATS